MAAANSASTGERPTTHSFSTADRRQKPTFRGGLVRLENNNEIYAAMRMFKINVKKLRGYILLIPFEPVTGIIAPKPTTSGEGILQIARYTGRTKEKRHRKGESARFPGGFFQTGCATSWRRMPLRLAVPLVGIKCCSAWHWKTSPRTVGEMPGSKWHRISRGVCSCGIFLSNPHRGGRKKSLVDSWGINMGEPTPSTIQHPPGAIKGHRFRPEGVGA